MIRKMGCVTAPEISSLFKIMATKKDPKNTVQRIGKKMASKRVDEEEIRCIIFNCI